MSSQLSQGLYIIVVLNEKVLLGPIEFEKVGPRKLIIPKVAIGIYSMSVIVSTVIHTISTTLCRYFLYKLLYPIVLYIMLMYMIK